MKRSRSPQEKKVLSYAKDGRNTVAEARSKSRTSIAKHKALANRALRRAEVVAVAKVSQSSVCAGNERHLEKERTIETGEKNCRATIHIVQGAIARWE